ncbi:gliding motility lipoprotein GldD [Patiriisocius marinistellae]|uniref:Gliding motility lipoprotein GldD n=1 Tax=Patiriisocius marinistellae TaxID=2494560 RepID=A0A5J4FUF5_9FLAO|nr:gliding motility lipoprotein GldD [Patiriisocius marinistellae]GEQ84622.1 gliding motility lipoprotein GldD [Patiriisocius marinistellae]
MRYLLLLSVFLIIGSCGEDVTVKPNAKLRLDYPAPTYTITNTGCDYNFLLNDNASLIPGRNCGAMVEYQHMNAGVYLTYQKIKNQNLDSLLYDAQKLAYNHDIKAQSIPEQVFENPDNKAYGIFYSINGNAASQGHFYLTDSVNNFITGSLYFEAKPNFDSIYPAVVYLREDIKVMMETMEWE